MAEVAVISTTVAILSLLINARNGLETLACDVDHFQRQQAELPSLVASLDISISNVRLWSDLWRVNDRTPASYHEEIWGPDGCYDINSLLNAIKNHARETRREIRKAYLNNNVTQKLKNTLFKSNIIYKRLNSLNNDFEKFDRLSKLKVLQTHGLKVPTDSFPELQQWINEYFTEAFLFNTAQESWPYSQALYEECLANKILSSELGLEELVQIPSSAKASSPSNEKLSSIVYDLTTQIQAAQQEPATIRFMILAVRENSHFPSCRVNQPYGFLPTHPPPHCAICRRPCCKQFFWLTTGSSDENLYSHDMRFFHNTSSKTDNSTCSSLQSLLQNEANDFMIRLHGSFAMRERLQLAYHLAVFVFMMLKTPWISHICNCTIVFRGTARHRTYRVKVRREIEHSDSSSPELHVSNCSSWCQDGFRSNPIERLGLILIEIATAQTICNARNNQDTSMIELNFCQERDEDGSPRYVAAIDAINRVQLEASADYADVVGWCLTQRLEPIDAHVDALEEFYVNVVKPYDNLLRLRSTS